MNQDILNLIGRKIRQHGHCDAAVCCYAEECYGPVGHVLGQDGNLVGGVEAECAEQARQLIGLVLEL